MRRFGMRAATLLLVAGVGVGMESTARAEVSEPNLATPDELKEYQEWVRVLPTDPLVRPGPPPVSEFRWDQAIEPDPNNPGSTIIVDYTTPSYQQTGGTCFLFASLGAMEIQASIDSNTWWDWGSETQRGIRLSALNLWDCDHYIGSNSGVASEGLDWGEYHGLPEDCLNPYAYPLPAHGFLFEDRPPCRNCNTNIGTWASFPSSCSPWQLAADRVLYYRHSGSSQVGVVGNKTRADLENLASAIHQGPVVEFVNWSVTATYGCVPWQPSVKCLECNEDQAGGGGHFITLIGYNIYGTNDLLLVRNSHGDEGPFWISYFDWAGQYDPANPNGCGLGTASVRPGSFSEPEPIPDNDVNAPQLGDDFHTNHPPMRICELDPNGNNADKAYVYPSMGNGASPQFWTFPPIETPVSRVSSGQRWLSGDFDGDGLDDLVKIYGPDGEARAWVHLANGSSFEYQSSFTILAGYWDEQNWMVGDFNGDGMDDLVNVYGASGVARAWVHLSTGSGFEFLSSITSLAGFSTAQKWMVGDFNGDLLDDLVNVYGVGGVARAWVHESTGTGFEYQSSFTSFAGFWDEQKWMVGNFDGDPEGKDDLVNVYGAGGVARAWVSLSTGTGFEYQSNLTSLAGFWDEQKWMVGDYNSDGKDDLVNVYGAAGLARAWVHQSTGSGFGYQSSWQTFEGFWPEQVWLAGDFIFQGATDIVTIY